MIRPKNEREDLLLSITKNCEKLIKQTHTKAVQKLEVKLTKPRQTYHLTPPIPTEGPWMMGLTSLEVYTSLSNITEENNKFELYGDIFDLFLVDELKDEVDEVLNISKITPSHLQHDIIGPRINQTYKKLRSEKPSSDGYVILIMA